MKGCCTGGGLPLYSKGKEGSKTARNKKLAAPGGAGTTKLAVLRDEDSAIP